MRNKLLQQKIREFLARKKDMEPVKPYSLQQRLSDIESGKITRTVTQVDHPGGSYEVVEYGDETEEVEII